MTAIRGRRHGERPTLPGDFYGAEEGGIPGVMMPEERRETCLEHLRNAQQVALNAIEHGIEAEDFLDALLSIRKRLDAAVDVAAELKRNAGAQTSATVKRRVLDTL